MSPPLISDRRFGSAFLGIAEWGPSARRFFRNPQRKLSRYHSMAPLCSPPRQPLRYSGTAGLF
jgi:hypothetical protein